LCNYKKDYAKGGWLAGPGASARAVPSQELAPQAEEMEKAERLICLSVATVGLFPV